MGKTVDQIIDIFASIDPRLEVSREAAQDMTAIPGPSAAGLNRPRKFSSASVSPAAVT